MTHSYRSHYFHLVWSTKDREDYITGEIESRLYAYIGGIVRNYQGMLLKIGGTTDHVHLLISINTPDKLTYLIRDLKAKSTLWVRQNFPAYQQFTWQEGYGSFTVSYSGQKKVSEYIEKQKEHHKIFSFEEEFLQILEKHHIKYDARFVLG